MGILIRQSLLNSLSSYAGLALGAVNTLVLYPLAFMPEHTDYYGLVQMILNYTLLVSTFTALGVPQVMVKFYKRLEEGLHANLGFFGLVVPVALLIPVAIVFLLFRAPLANWLTENPSDAGLVERYLPLLILTTAFNVYFEVFASISQAHLRSVLPLFLKEVGRRVVASLLLVIYLLGWIDFDLFIWLFCIMFPLQFVVMLVVLQRKRQLKVRWGFGALPMRTLLDFGFFSFLAFGGDLLVNRIDQLMIAKYIDLESVAFYTIAFFIGNVINTPNRASGGIVKPIIANLLEKNKIEELNDLYKRSSIGLTVVSGFLLVVIIPNLPQIYQLLPIKFEGGVWVTVLIAASKFVSTSIGINGQILSMSPYYRMTLWMNIGLIITTILTNLWLIPAYGIAGAAMATMLVILFNNGWKTIFLYRKYQLLPFSKPYFLILFWIMACTTALYYFSQVDSSPWLGIPIRGLLASMVFLLPVYWLNVFPEMNAFVNRMGHQMRKAIG